MSEQHFVRLICATGQVLKAAMDQTEAQLIMLAGIGGLGDIDVKGQKLVFVAGQFA